MEKLLTEFGFTEEDIKEYNSYRAQDGDKIALIAKQVRKLMLSSTATDIPFLNNTKALLREGFSKYKG